MMSTGLVYPEDRVPAEFSVTDGEYRLRLLDRQTGLRARSRQGCELDPGPSRVANPHTEDPGL